MFATAKPRAQTDREFTWRFVQMSVFLRRKGYDSAMMPGARIRQRNGLPVSCPVEDDFELRVSAGQISQWSSLRSWAPRSARVGLVRELSS